MKVEIKEKAKITKREYPYLGYHKESKTVVIFISEFTGINLSKNNDMYCPGFNEDAFVPFEGEITLSND